MVVFEQKGCIPAKVAVFEQNRLYSAKWLYSGKSGCTRAKVFCIWTKWLYSCKVVVKNGCIRAKVGCIRENWLHSGKSGSGKVVVFGQK